MLEDKYKRSTKRQKVFFITLLLILSAVFLFPTKPKTIDKSYVTDKVKNLPEVKKYLVLPKNNVSGIQRFIRVDDSDKSFFIVQVGSIIKAVSNDPETGHASTFNWYKVNKENGKIVCSMFSYNAEGIEVKSDKLINCL